jgi:hypothetical protein
MPPLEDFSLGVLRLLFVVPVLKAAIVDDAARSPLGIADSLVDSTSKSKLITNMFIRILEGCIFVYMYLSLQTK